MKENAIDFQLQRIVKSRNGDDGEQSLWQGAFMWAAIPPSGLPSNAGFSQGAQVTALC